MESATAINKVNREDLLHTLESVKSGLSTKAIIEQSDCFVFKKGKVISYNDEVACSAPSPLGKAFEGAVKAEKLIEVLTKLPEDELQISIGTGELILSGKRRRTGIHMEAEITLPLEAVEKPTEWKKLHEDFGEAIAAAAACTSTDESRFDLVCVHIHPKWVEACDDFQICRWRLLTGISQSTLVRQAAIKNVTSLGMTDFCETEGWLHFKNAHGLVLSCRRYMEEYPDLSQWLKVEGDVIAFPKGLVEAAEKASIFSSEDQDNNRVLVDLKPGKLKIRGQGSSGWYEESKSIKAYTGRHLRFYVSPDLLSALVKRTNDCIVSADRIKVSGGKLTYCVCLMRPEEGNGAVEEDAVADEAEAEAE